MLGELRARLEKQGYLLRVNGAVLTAIVKKGFNQAFGARELRRVIQNTIENKIAERVLKGEYKKGDTIELVMTDIV